MAISRVSKDLVVALAEIIKSRKRAPTGKDKDIPKAKPQLGNVTSYSTKSVNEAFAEYTAVYMAHREAINKWLDQWNASPQKVDKTTALTTYRNNTIDLADHWRQFQFLREMVIDNPMLKSFMLSIEKQKLLTLIDMIKSRNDSSLKVNKTLVTALVDIVKAKRGETKSGHKYIRRIGAPGHYEYTYADIHVNRVKELPTVKEKVAYLVQEHLKEHGVSHVSPAEVRDIIGILGEQGHHKSPVASIYHIIKPHLQVHIKESTADRLKAGIKQAQEIGALVTEKLKTMGTGTVEKEGLSGGSTATTAFHNEIKDLTTLSEHKLSFHIKAQSTGAMLEGVAEKHIFRHNGKLYFAKKASPGMEHMIRTSSSSGHITSVQREALYVDIVNEISPELNKYFLPAVNIGKWVINPHLKDEEYRTIGSWLYEQGANKRIDVSTDDLLKLLAVNSILGNGDRHMSNALVSNSGKLVLIDNGYSFTDLYSNGFWPSYTKSELTTREGTSAHVYSITPQNRQMLIDFVEKFKGPKIREMMQKVGFEEANVDFIEENISRTLRHLKDMAYKSYTDIFKYRPI